MTYGLRNIKDTFQNQKVYLIMLSLKNILQVWITWPVNFQFIQIHRFLDYNLEKYSQWGIFFSLQLSMQMTYLCTFFFNLNCKYNVENLIHELLDADCPFKLKSVYNFLIATLKSGPLFKYIFYIHTDAN